MRETTAADNTGKFVRNCFADLLSPCKTTHHHGEGADKGAMSLDSIDDPENKRE
jgi:hypothetical protein